MTDRLTPTQRRMLAILADGLPHTREQLHGCLQDELQPLQHIQAHISGIRKVLRARGEDVICELFEGRPHYRHVRLINHR